MSSLASFRGTPQAPALLRQRGGDPALGEGIRGRLRHRGVIVSVICPGFIATPMTAGNPFPMPLLVSADRGAAVIARGLAWGRYESPFPGASMLWHDSHPQDFGGRLLAGFWSKE